MGKPAPVPKLYRRGMTQQQFQQALAADPGYQAILHDPANRAANGQLTPLGWGKANQYASAAGLYEMNAASAAGTSPSGAFHSGPSSYGIGGNGEVTEQHDGWWNPATAGTLLATGLGIYTGGSALGWFGGGGATAGTLGPSTAANIAATDAAATSAPAGIAATGAVPAAAGTAATVGTTAADAGGDAAAWGADGSFLGDTTISSSSGATGSSIYSRLLSKYGAGAVSQGVDEYLQEKRSEDQLEARRRETEQRTALEESELDPFRGLMAQSRDMARLDLMGRDYTPTPLQLDAKYGAGVDIPQGPSYAPTALTRQVLQGAQRNVAAGNTVPTMTNPQNYGNIPVVRTDPAAMASASPVARPLGPAMSRRRRWPGQTDDENSPWLRPSV